MSRCSLCRQEYEQAILEAAGAPYAPLIPLIQARHFGWSPKMPVCPDCALHWMKQFAATRSPESLHDRTFPHTTFPYYQQEEEEILSLPERLPHHEGWSGAGVTIGFLDSGYYPHPDLSWRKEAAPNLLAARSDIGRTRRLLETEPLRIRQYVNLQEGKVRLGVDAPSLWSDAPNSWHGQMTITLAAGNGLLSQGRYQSYAPEAEVLPVKIGRLSGAIPEQDILTGLRWFQHAGRWEHYGVRVLNISVGGDYPQPWWENDVCLSVEELSNQGVLVVAASGNSGDDTLLAPAQAPSALTVGGIDDANRRLRNDRAEDRERIRAFHHSFGSVYEHGESLQKPEILAPSIWIPSPLLPVHSIFRESWAIGEARAALAAGEIETARRVLLDWRGILELDANVAKLGREEIGSVLRFLMNPRKWIHPFYQHVDGSSVAAPQVSAVAAQIFQAMPGLSPDEVKAILIESALPLEHLPPHLRGSGLLQPTRALATALRRPTGPLYGLPYSGDKLSPNELRFEELPSRVAAPVPEGNGAESTSSHVSVYLGFWAPDAASVSLIGTFNSWRPQRLMRTENGWWHALFLIPPGEHHYRFWVEDGEGEGEWYVDPENPLRGESGLSTAHSLLVV